MLTLSISRRIFAGVSRISAQQIALFSGGECCGGGCHSSSDADFQPKKKIPVPEGIDDAVKLIGEQVKNNPVIIYMKGNPKTPQCGFSYNAVRILQNLGVSFASVNVLDYPMIREGCRKYSDWPTFPQLFVSGEFVGGCDIMTQMNENGQLKDLFTNKGLLKN